MPIRVYEIAQALNLSSKLVLAKAREMGIAAARVPSSSLDKITAEYLREHLLEWQSKQPAAASSPALQPVPPTPVVAAIAQRPTAGAELRVASQPGAAPVQSASAQRLASQQAARPVVPIIPSPSDGPKAANPSSAAARPQTLPVTTAGNSAAPRKEFAEPSYARFERTIRRLLDSRFPNCTLSSVLLFRPDQARFSNETPGANGRPDYAYEVDHLLHRASASQDNLIVIECKNQRIRVEAENTWLVEYASGPKNVLPQLKRQAETLRAYVNPLSRGRQLTINVILVSSDPDTRITHRQAQLGVSFFLCGTKDLLAALETLMPPPLRVAQSDILNLIRLGVPSAELGHPELNNALAYIERCRRNIDVELFRAFSPSAERWAINGSAGMGKSVLLAYSLFVFSTNRRVATQDGRKELADFSEQASSMGLPPPGQRRVYAFALKEKQRHVLSTLYRRFVDEFAPLSEEADLGFRHPDIRLWDGKIPPDCHVLVIDEAHDLSASHAATVAAWINTSGKQRYLLIACDRHQKLRLVGRDETIIEGVNFSLKTKKLRLNYRNPFAVYAASLGMMFRWFAPAGPKVLPAKDDLESGFGLTVEQPYGQGLVSLSMRNDAHPGNTWSHCVELFSHPEGALARLRPFRFKSQDVLWVRFADEDEHFDYEQLSCFTYHNLNCAESVELTDKYIKGQDFPIVVIEGASEDMNQWADPAAEQRMWQRRKELYICASRATAFLFLVGNRGEAEKEFVEIVRQLSAPERDDDGFPRAWRFRVTQPGEGEIRRMDVFSDASEAAATQ